METPKNIVVATLVALVIIILVSALGAIYFDPTRVVKSLTIFMGVFVFACYLFLIGLSKHTGHTPKQMILGLPRYLFVAYLVSIILLSLALIATQPFGERLDTLQRNVVSIAIASSAGLVCSIAIWILEKSSYIRESSWKRRTRRKLKRTRRAEKKSQRKAEKKIRRLKQTGKIE